MIPKKVKAGYNVACNIEATISAVCLMIAVVVIFTLAIFRSFGFPIRWALDTALLVFTWGVFLGADVAFREDKLINVDFLLSALPSKAQTAVQTVLNVIIGAFLVALIYYGIDLSISTWHRSFQGIPELSYTWVTISIPVSSFLMLITVSIKVYRAFTSRDEDETKPSTAKP